MLVKEHSLWRSSSSEAAVSNMDQDHRVDVCVIGAGIAGLSTAYHLSKKNIPTIVIDAGHVGGGVTSDTTAHLTWRLDTAYSELHKLFGEDTKLIADSHREAIKLIEKNIDDENIDCNFQYLSGYLLGPRKDSEASFVNELKLLYEYGYTEVQPTTLNQSINKYCLHYPVQAQFHPLRYLDGLSRSITNHGGKIYPHTKAIEIQTGKSIRVKTQNGFTISCNRLVVATNTPINNLFKMHTKQAPYQSYVIASRVPRYSYPHALYWDDLDPYHYVRFLSGTDYDFLIVGGEDHKTGQKDDAAERFLKLRRWSLAHFPMATEIEYQWCNQVMEPIDDIAFIGKNPGEENVFIATGFSGNGMTYGTIAGQLLSDMIIGNSNPYIKVYSPSRISLHAFGEFAKENLNVAAQFKDWIAPGEKPSTDDIAVGEGKIIRDGVRVLAVYKDEEGFDHCMSAKCPHLGCVVHWNTAAKTWDCPCHGSRFTKLGEVVNGPAVQNLAQLNGDSVPAESPMKSATRKVP